MEILAHRGLWSAAAEKNTQIALESALRRGYGVETDLRDFRGRVVVAHDPPKGSSYSGLDLLDLLALYRRVRSRALLALNVKADGIGLWIRQALSRARVTNYFCFDMSGPETVSYIRQKCRFYARQSEHEPAPTLYEPAKGVWIDMMQKDWVRPHHIRAHLACGKKAALVSPELHGRDHMAFWKRLRGSGLHRDSGLALCTDFPDEAAIFFARNGDRAR